MRLLVMDYVMYSCFKVPAVTPALGKRDEHARNMFFFILIMFFVYIVHLFSNYIFNLLGLLESLWPGDSTQVRSLGNPKVAVLFFVLPFAIAIFRKWMLKDDRTALVQRFEDRNIYSSRLIGMCVVMLPLALSASTLFVPWDILIFFLLMIAIAFAELRLRARFG